MGNLKLGGILLVVGAAMFLLSDTIFGDSEATAYAIFFGLILFPLGFILMLVGLFQFLATKFKQRQADK